MQRVFEFWKEDNALPEGNESAYILGRRFEVQDGQWSPEFQKDVETLIWLMYRTQFPVPIARDPEGPSPLLQNVNAFFRTGPSAIQTSNIMDSFSSDVGWGCMIRTGQSLLANSLLRLQQTRVQAEGSVDDIEILRKFRDEPDAVYSIHHFVSYGADNCGKLPGQWFGPSAVASCIANFSTPEVDTYIAPGMDIFEEEVTKKSFPLLILCNIRLGISEINPVYYAGLRDALTNDYSVGIAGGRTSASVYFYGVQGTRLFYHDPHEPKQALTSGTTDEELKASTHSSRVRAMNFQEVDPSMLVGFLLPERDDFAKFKELISKIPEKERIIHISSTPPSLAMETMDENSDLSESDEILRTDGYVVCSTPEPELLENIEAKEPREESLLLVDSQISADTARPDDGDASLVEAPSSKDQSTEPLEMVVDTTKKD